MRIGKKTFIFFEKYGFVLVLITILATALKPTLSIEAIESTALMYRFEITKMYGDNTSDKIIYDQQMIILTTILAFILLFLLKIILMYSVSTMLGAIKHKASLVDYLFKEVFSKPLKFEEARNHKNRIKKKYSISLIIKDNKEKKIKLNICKNIIIRYKLIKKYNKNVGYSFYQKIFFKFKCMVFYSIFGLITSNIFNYFI